MTIPPKYEDVVAKLGAERELHKLATETLGQFADENQKLHANLAALREELDQCGSMAAMVESKEWAEHAGSGPVSSRVESAFTQMHNELSEAQQRLTVAEQQSREMSVAISSVIKAAVFHRGVVEIDTNAYHALEDALKPAAEGEGS